MKLLLLKVERESAYARSITSAVAVIDLVKWSENPNHVCPTEGK